MLEGVLNRWNAEWKFFLEEQKLAMLVGLQEKTNELLRSSEIYSADILDHIHSLFLKGSGDIVEVHVCHVDEGDTYDTFSFSRNMKETMIIYDYTRKELDEWNGFEKEEAIFLANLIRKFKGQIIEASIEITRTISEAEGRTVLEGK